MKAERGLEPVNYQLIKRTALFENAHHAHQNRGAEEFTLSLREDVLV